MSDLENTKLEGCAQYRSEHLLLILQKKLEQENLPPGERAELQQQLARLEQELGMD